NSAEDGPATIGVYKGLQVQALSTRAGIDNINNAISYMQTVDDAGAAIENLLMRMKEIAVQAQTSTTDADQRTALSLEYLALGRQWDRIVADTKWNGVQVMTGTDLDIGVGSGTHLDIAIDDWRSTAFGAGAAAANIATGAATTAAASSAGAAFDFSTANIAFEDFTTGANDAADIALALLQMNKVTTALENIGKSRAELGAHINAMKASANSMSDLADRYESNASAIGDANYAAESAKLATAQIVSQAATAMLAQANAQKGTVLSLLQ
ncbi:flagellin, partial [Gammaproteobacteria bacterium]|nr:flagellin [Gammaproteobacteria bacterium]